MIRFRGRSPFSYKRDGEIVEVWLGPADNPRSERVLRLHYTWLPQLRATLKLVVEELAQGG